MNEEFKDVVITSRVRLARNIKDYPFPAKLKDNRALRVAADVFEAVKAAGRFSLFKITELSELDGQCMREKHLISGDLLTSAAGAVIINEAENIIVMINEEDHIREQCILKGLALNEAYRAADGVDNAISSKIAFAFDSRLGYLTACPTNLGTGMRASALMFLPGLSLSHSLEAVVAAVSRLDLTVRGVYGEGTDGEGFLYQISNQKTLGVSEPEIIENVSAGIRHVAESERRARGILLENAPVQLRDKAYRAYGLLRSSYVMRLKEFMELYGLVKLGAYLGVLKIERNAEAFDSLITECQPANLSAAKGALLSASDADVYRAEYLRSFFG